MTAETAAAPAGHAARHLCICADDFGMSAGINAAVFDLAGRGRISATSCMVRRDAWPAGLRGLREMPPDRVDVGLHLDLSRPREGEVAERNLGGLILQCHLGLQRPDCTRAEIREQLTRFEDGLGRPPAFVDGHRHVHQLPVVRDMLTEEMAARYGAGATRMPWLRSTAPPSPRRIARSKADIIFALGGAKLLAAAARHRIPTSRRLLGVYDFAGDREHYRDRLQHWIGQSRSGDVLMCHPSRGTPTDPLDSARRQEYAVLAAAAFPAPVADGLVFLAPLSRLLRADAPPWHP